jgi:ABC-type microcin C transport system permease subunit YejB
MSLSVWQNQTEHTFVGIVYFQMMWLVVFFDVGNNYFPSRKIWDLLVLRGEKVPP